jgi:glycosyltransferase involved in cell wall biosynthesis
MKILLSAYACEPGAGSEPGIGWHWAIEIARLGHEVHILTRANNVDAIERGLSAIRSPDAIRSLDAVRSPDASGGLDVKVHGYDLPRWARWWKKGPRGMHVYYLLWQMGAYRRARRLHQLLLFDMVHHITFGVFRHPSFMGRLGIPFVFGPVGGGESTPPALLRSLPVRGRILEALRGLANRAALLDPLLLATFRQATLICCNTPETEEQIPARFRGKSVCVHDVAIDGSRVAAAPSTGGRPRFLFAGRLLYWKGLHLALRALAVLRRELPDAELTVVGDGKDRAWLQEFAQRQQLGDAVQWKGWVPREQVIASYATHAAFLFPSLHDSGGTVIMEAMAQGLPVICLDLGGPGAILPEHCGLKIGARGRTEEQVVADLVDAMRKLAVDAHLRQQLAINALEAAKHQTWAELVGGAYRQIHARLLLG